MFSIKRIHKKQYITPVIEFEMIEEEGALMYVSGTNQDSNEIPDPDPNGSFGKRSDFIFDDSFDSKPVENTSDGELSW